MHWGKIVAIGLCCGLGSACGPAGAAADTDADTDTDTDGTGSASTDSDGSESDPSAGSMSGSATSSTSGATVDPSGETTEGSADTTQGSADATEGSGGSETGECPFGTEGCLCDVGAQCEEGLDCNDEGVCVAPPDCRPIDADPHDDEATAIELEAVDCDQGIELGLIGTIEGPQTDWYTYLGNDGIICTEQPIAIAAADDPLEVCLYLECGNGGDVTPLDCGGKSTLSESPEGRPGCCGDGLAFVEDYGCTGFGGKSADVFVSVASAEQVCIDYSLEYGF